MHRAVALVIGDAVLTLAEGELLFGREHQLVAARQAEVQQPGGEPDHHPVDARAIVRVERQDDQRHRGDHSSHDGARDAQRAAVGPMDVRHLAPQDHERRHLHDVGDHCSEHRHVEQGPSDVRVVAELIQGSRPARSPARPR